VKRPLKITLAEMRSAGVRGLLIYCSDYHCSHWTAISGDRWPDDVRLSDLEPRFTCASSKFRAGVDRLAPASSVSRHALFAIEGEGTFRQTKKFALL
jgi:hypothetical protein